MQDRQARQLVGAVVALFLWASVAAAAPAGPARVTTVDAVGLTVSTGGSGTWPSS